MHCLVPRETLQGSMCKARWSHARVLGQGRWLRVRWMAKEGKVDLVFPEPGAVLFGHEVVDPDHLGRPRDGLRDAAQGVDRDLMAHQGGAYCGLAQASFPGQIGGMPASADQLAPQPSAVNGDAHRRHLSDWPPKREY